MALWGIITACSRITANGWEAYPEALIRAANGGLPLAILLYWLNRQRLKPTRDVPEESTHETVDVYSLEQV